MKRLLIALLLLAPSAAYATQSSILCKTDTDDYIDVVSKGERTNDVLVQINGGKFFDGHSLLMNNILIVTVDFIEGGLMMNMDVSGKGDMLMSVKDKNARYTLNCKFRK